MDPKQITETHRSNIYDNFLVHWKYVKREKIAGGKWKYYYDLNDANGGKTKAETASSVAKVANAGKAKVSNMTTAAKNKVVSNTEKAKSSINAAIESQQVKTQQAIDTQKTKTKEAIKAAPKKAVDAADKGVQKTVDVANDTGKKVMTKVNEYYDKNIYETDGYNINTKKEQIALTDEWKKIVETEDPEYVKTNPDGTKTYLLDEYLVKKKHPELDLLDDLGNGRDITINKLDADALAAGAKDYVDTTVQTIGLVSYLLMTKFKLSQGSYNDEMKAAQQTIENGAKYCNELYNQADVSYEELAKNAGAIPETVDVAELENIAMAVVTEAAAEVVKETTKEAVKDVAKEVATEAGKEVVDYYEDQKRKKQ